MTIRKKAKQKPSLNNARELELRQDFIKEVSSEHGWDPESPGIKAIWENEQHLLSLDWNSFYDFVNGVIDPVTPLNYERLPEGIIVKRGFHQLGPTPIQIANWHIHEGGGWMVNSRTITVGTDQTTVRDAQGKVIVVFEMAGRRFGHNGIGNSVWWLIENATTLVTAITGLKVTHSEIMRDRDYGFGDLVFEKTSDGKWHSHQVKVPLAQ